MDEIRSLLKTIRGVGPNKPVTQLQLSEIIRALHRERINLYDEYYTGGVKPSAIGKNSVAIGEGAKSTSYREMLAGSFPEELTATPDEWVSTDRLFGIGNGIDADNRHDAFRVYKSGYAQLNNGLRLGAYSWGTNNPEAGALQYTAGGSISVYRNTTWNRLAFIDSFAANNQFAYFDSLTETLKTRAIAIADITGLQTALDGKAPASGSSNYVHVSPESAQAGDIWMLGYIRGHAAGETFSAVKTDNSPLSIRFSNYGGDVYFGVENSVGDYFAANPFESVIYSPGNNLYIKSPSLRLSGGLTGTTANFSGAATAASFVFGTTGWSFEVVADRLVVKKNGVILDALDAVGNRKIAGDGYGGGV